MSASDPSFTYEIAPEAGLVLARMAGTLTGEGMLEILETVHADPRWESGFDVIWDCSAVEGHVVAPGDVHPLVIEDVRGGDGREVLVPNRSLTDEVIAQMLAVFARRKGKDVRVCSSLEEALAELDRDALPAGLQGLTMT